MPEFVSTSHTGVLMSSSDGAGVRRHVYFLVQSAWTYYATAGVRRRDGRSRARRVRLPHLSAQAQRRLQRPHCLHPRLQRHLRAFFRALQQADRRRLRRPFPLPARRGHVAAGQQRAVQQRRLARLQRYGLLHQPKPGRRRQGDSDGPLDGRRADSQLQRVRHVPRPAAHDGRVLAADRALAGDGGAQVPRVGDSRAVLGRSSCSVLASQDPTQGGVRLVAARGAAVHPEQGAAGRADGHGDRGTRLRAAREATAPPRSVRALQQGPAHSHSARQRRPHQRLPRQQEVHCQPQKHRVHPRKLHRARGRRAQPRCRAVQRHFFQPAAEYSRRQPTRGSIKDFSRFIVVYNLSTQAAHAMTTIHNPNNWHWVDKNCLSWANAYFQERLPKVRAASDNHTFSVSSVKPVAGDCDVTQRKGKVRCIFDLQVEFVVQVDHDGSVSEHTVRLVEFEHDQQSFEFEVSGDAEKKALVRTHLVPEARAVFERFQDDLLATFESELKHNTS
ncbi:hypothetical protein KL933_002363 [Ogataea haglerorum]|uniref:Activator of Hsp90 ATPase AHSA1-like N-terminal domain-containing protein n=1 Tax=Ogataea haglerorum TaxID=1937702 RepID=A0AAN6I0Z4_9ASCO|nr:hypothetical protein KL933_002363 [Ogataea haglerorum]